MNFYIISRVTSRSFKCQHERVGVRTQRPCCNFNAKNSKSASTGFKKGKSVNIKETEYIHHDDEKYWMSMNGKAVGMDFEA